MFPARLAGFGQKFSGRDFFDFDRFDCGGLSFDRLGSD
jgi:hypothetical protein